jgi:hypothetical protein
MNTKTNINTKCRVNTFLTCDAVHVDPATGKHTILGIFSSLRGKDFPIVHPKMVWFLSLSELTKGEHHLKMSIADLTGELDTRVIIDRHFDTPDPLVKVNLVNDIHRLKFVEAKNYSIVVEVDDEIVFVDSFPVRDVGVDAELRLKELLEEYDEEYDDGNYDDDDYHEEDDSVF